MHRIQNGRHALTPHCDCEYLQNATEKYNNVQVKKLTVPSNEANHTKRAALGDLQNRGLNRGVISKDAAQKE